MHFHLTYKILWPFAAVSLLLLTLGVTGAWHVHQLQMRSSQILAFNVASIQAAEELEIIFREIRSRINQFLWTHDWGSLEQIPQLDDEAEYWLAEAARLAATSEEQSLIDNVRGGYLQFRKEFATIERGQDVDTNADTARHLATVVLSDDVLAHTRRYLDLNEHQLLQSSVENQRLASRLILGLLVLGTCGALAGGISGYAFARAVRRLTVRLEVPIRDVQGKLNEVVEPISISADPGIDGLDVVLGTISTRVSRVVEELQQTQRDAVRSEQLAAVGQLAAGLAHELRNPLMAMKVLVQSASAEGDEGTLTTTDLHVMSEEIDRLEQLVKTFLDFAQPPRLQRRSFDLRQTVCSVMHLLEPRAVRRGIHVVLQTSPAPIAIEADESQLRQVLMNLLINAMEAVRTGGRIEIRIRPSVDEQHNPWTTIEVTDDGCGLPAELGQRIFDPFVSTKETGVGLGLSICRRIVESHDGKIRCQTRPEGGSLFTVQLPTRQPIELPSTSRAPSLAVETPETLNKSGAGCRHC